MPIKYIPYIPDTIEGQAILNKLTRTQRVLRYRDGDKVHERILRGMPYYEVATQETVGNPDHAIDNLVLRGECISACAYLKANNIQVDLVYIDPPFASGADYAKKVYIRRNPKLAEKVAAAEQQMDIEELRAFEEKMYGDIWQKEDYLNWMYENLMAIKSVMSDTASIYVHLDRHIGHYVKILMDEVFGEENFINEVVWYYRRWNIAGKTFAANHDTLFYYGKNREDYTFNQLYIPKSEKSSAQGKSWKSVIGEDGIRKSIMTDEPTKGVPMPSVWEISMINPVAIEREIGYATQKPEALLERIIKASSNEGMVVADFFGGSGVTAKVAHDLGRHFIHSDVGVNSIQTVRDRLVEAGANFQILEIQDGVSLFRNPQQTMDKLATLIPSLSRRVEGLSNFWFGAIHTAKDGVVPVYVPDLINSQDKVLDIPVINRIINQELHDLTIEAQKVIVYYVDVDDIDAINAFIKDQNTTLIEVELRDLKHLLHEMVIEDELSVHVLSTDTGFTVQVNRLVSDRLTQKIRAFNEKGLLNTSKNKSFTPIQISEEGLELIEWLAVDCDNADKNAPWHSNTELKITKEGYVVRNGVKSKEFWNGCITCEKKPLRIKVRNICGDETVCVCTY